MDKVKKPMKQMPYEEALSRCAALCSGAEYCIQQMQEKMAKWNVSSADADKVIDYLLEERYINEGRFARAYANDKLRYNHWGKVKIGQMLCYLHIDMVTIHEALAEIDDEEYRRILTDLLTSKAKSVKADSEFERNGKLIRYAVGKGFEMGVVCRLLHAEDME